MSIFSGFISGIKDELVSTARGLKDRGNQLLLLVVVLIILVSLAVGWGMLRYDALLIILNQSRCRTLSTGQVLALMYMTFAFGLLAMLVLGGFFSMVQKRESLISMRRNPQTSPLYKEAKRQVALYTVLFTFSALLLWYFMSQWC